MTETGASTATAPDKPSNPVGWTEALGSENGMQDPPRVSGEQVVALGQVWKVASCENGIKALQEQWVRAGAQMAIYDAEKRSSEEADKLRSVYMADFQEGKYSWAENWGDTSNYVRQSLSKLRGAMHLFGLLLKRCHPTITEEQVRKVWADNPRGCLMSYRWALGLPMLWEGEQSPDPTK